MGSNQRHDSGWTGRPGPGLAQLGKPGRRLGATISDTPPAPDPRPRRGLDRARPPGIPVRSLPCPPLAHPSAPGEGGDGDHLRDVPRPRAPPPAPSAASTRPPSAQTAREGTRPRHFLGSPVLHGARDSRVAVGAVPRAPPSSDRPGAAPATVGLSHPIPGALGRWLVRTAPLHLARMQMTFQGCKHLQPQAKPLTPGRVSSASDQLDFQRLYEGLRSAGSPGQPWPKNCDRSRCLTIMR